MSLHQQQVNFTVQPQHHIYKADLITGRDLKQVLGGEAKRREGGLSPGSESSLEAGDLQLLDAPLVAEFSSGDTTAWASFFTQPHLPKRRGESQQVRL